MSTKNFIRGGQITLHNFRMFNQIFNKIIILSLGIFIIFFITFIYIKTNPHTYKILNLYFWNQLLGKPKLKANFIQYVGNLFYQATIYGILFSGVCSSFLIYMLKKYGGKHTQDERVKGDYLEKPENLKKLLIKQKIDADLKFGIPKLPMVRNSEKQHFLFDGTTGSGKSTAIKELLDYIRKSDDRAIIWDEGGNYLSEFYDANTDKLLNPLDQRGVNWSLWKECADLADFENLAASLIPLSGNQDPFWVMGARSIFSELAYAMRNDANKNHQKLLENLLSTDLSQIKKYLDNTFAASLVSEKIEKTALSIKSVMAAYLKSLKYVNDADNLFSIRNWIKDEENFNKNSSWLFISSVEKKHEALKPLITTFLDIAISEILSLSENQERRIWVILDELASLNKIPSLFNILSRGRKPGGIAVIGIQNYAQLSDIYGKDGAKAISSLLNTRFMFRQVDPDLADWSARNLGEIILDEVREGISYGANTMRDGISVNRTELRKPLVSKSEIMLLDNLNCFIRLPGNLPITKLNFQYQKRDKINLPFMEKDFRYESIKIDVPADPQENLEVKNQEELLEPESAELLSVEHV